MRVKCYSVRLESLYSISDKAYKANAFDGSSYIIPKSQVFGIDKDVLKSEAYWISAWIVEKKGNLQYSEKKIAWFDSETGKRLPTYIVEKHKPDKIDAIENNEITRLRSDKG